MQPHEIRKIFHAYKERRKDEDFRRAYFISWMVNTQLRKPISPQDIFDPLWKTEEDKRKELHNERKLLLEEFAGILRNDKQYNTSENTTDRK